MSKDDLNSTGKSPKDFRWTQPYEDTLLELLVRETRKGNRPDSSFTSSAFRNVIKDFNRIHDTHIVKKHVHSWIKTLKQSFVLFNGAFNGLSGFAWNEETKMFEAEVSVWEQRIQKNQSLQKLRDKNCHNWDKMFELYGDTRATGSGARSLKERAKNLERQLEFDDIGLSTSNINSCDNVATDCSSYGDHDFSMFDAAPFSTPDHGTTQQSRGSSKQKLKRKASLISVMEDGYKTMASSIDKLFMALQNKFDVKQNTQIHEVLDSLGLDEDYKFRCYCYLCANPSKAALVVAAPHSFRVKLLNEIMMAADKDKLYLWL